MNEISSLNKKLYLIKIIKVLILKINIYSNNYINQNIIIFSKQINRKKKINI